MATRARPLLATLAAAAVLLATTHARAQDGPTFERTAFDTAIATRKLPIPAHGNDAAREAVCTAYAGFIVKQVSTVGDMGAEAISVLPFAAGHAPPCRLAAAAGEHAVALDVLDKAFPGVEFAGVKGGFVFLASADAVHDAVGFAVVRSSDGKILANDWTHSALTFRPAAQGELVARYTRMIGGDCSVMQGGEACAQQIVRASGTAAPSVALCKAGYQRAYAPYVESRCQGDADPACPAKARGEIDQSPSVIFVPAETTVTATDATTRVLGAPTACFPSE